MGHHVVHEPVGAAGLDRTPQNRGGVLMPILIESHSSRRPQRTRRIDAPIQRAPTLLGKQLAPAPNRVGKFPQPRSNGGRLTYAQILVGLKHWSLLAASIPAAVADPAAPDRLETAPASLPP